MVRGFVALVAVLIVCLALSGRAAAQTPARPADTDAKLFDVLLAGKHQGRPRIGRVAVDGKNLLQTVWVASKQKEFLSEIVEAMNGKAVLHVESAPPKDAPRFANASRIVKRTSPEFFTESQTYLRHYYNITLIPVSK
ncbi:MAG: hypothetical protein WCO67_15790 [Betaproteobacteria bacterium]